VDVETGVEVEVEAESVVATGRGTRKSRGGGGPPYKPRGAAKDRARALREDALA
jgi:hypothetical protein